MRVHLGSDQPGSTSSDSSPSGSPRAVTRWSTTARPPTTRRTTTRPTACVPPRPPPQAGTLGVVIGGRGNGEQIAANKVRACARALAWNGETARLGRQHNNANVVGGRAPGCTPPTRPSRSSSSSSRSRSRTIPGTSGGSHADRLRGQRGTAPAPLLIADARRRFGARPRRPCPRLGRVPEGHTLHRLANATSTRSGGRSCTSRARRAGSPPARSSSTAGVLAAQAHGKHVFLGRLPRAAARPGTARAGPLAARAPRPLRDRAFGTARPAGQGRPAAAHGERRRRGPTCAGPPPAS